MGVEAIKSCIWYTALGYKIPNYFYFLIPVQKLLELWILKQFLSIYRLCAYSLHC